MLDNVWFAYLDEVAVSVGGLSETAEALYDEIESVRNRTIAGLCLEPTPSRSPSQSPPVSRRSIVIPNSGGALMARHTSFSGSDDYGDVTSSFDESRSGYMSPDRGSISSVGSDKKTLTRKGSGRAQLLHRADSATRQRFASKLIGQLKTKAPEKLSWRVTVSAVSLLLLLE